MKIISITIGGFGKLKNQSFTFKEITQILSENGKGKSTLANFIECMFYGIDAKNSVQRAYLPWENAVFGGNLTFETNGKIYRIERTFGDKKSRDTFALYFENGLPSFDFTERIGEELFSLDRESFHRVCFFDQSDYEGGQTYISGRLNALITDTDEFDGFEKIEDGLNKKIKSYQNKQNHGLIPDVKEKIADADQGIRTLFPYKDRYFALQDELLSARNKKAELERQLLKTEKENEELLKKISSLESETALNMLNENEAETRRALALLEKDFSLNGLTEIQVDYHIEKCLSLEKKTAEYKQEENSFYPQENINLPSLETIEAEKQNYENAVNAKKTTPFIFPPVCFALALLFCALGAFKRNFFLIGIGSGVAVGGIIWLVSAIKGNKKIKLALARTQDFLGRYGYQGFSPSSAFEKLKTDVENYTVQRTYINERRLYLSSLKQEIIAENDNIERFISAFCKKKGEKITLLAELKNTARKKDELLAQLEKIKADKQRFSLSLEASNLKERYSRLNEIKLSLKGEIESCEQRTNLINNELSVCERNLEKYDELVLRKSTLENELETLEKEKTVAEKTLFYLQKAKENLTNGYLEPVKKSLKKYVETLLGLEETDLDENFKVTFTSGGIRRSFTSLSLGQRQLVNFALRLGLIDALFPEEKPFIIIDDAFCPLDAENLAICSKMIKKLSETVQVIYLTPHPSRSLKNN